MNCSSKQVAAESTCVRRHPREALCGFSRPCRALANTSACNKGERGEGAVSNEKKVGEERYVIHPHSSASFISSRTDSVLTDPSMRMGAILRGGSHRFSTGGWKKEIKICEDV